MKNLTFILLILSSSSAFALEYSLGLYTAVSGRSEFETSSIDDTGDIGPGDISYLFKVDYAVNEQFKVGLESGRLSYDAHFTGEETYFTRKFTAQIPLALRFSYAVNKHLFTLSLVDTLHSDSENLYDNNTREGSLEYGYPFAEKFSANVRVMQVEGDSSSSSSADKAENTVMFLGLSYTI